MAVLQMQRLLICALRKDRKSILELLQRRGVIEISDTLVEDNIFHKSDVTKVKSELERNIALVKDAIEILTSYQNEKKSMLAPLYGLKEASTEDYSDFREKHDAIIQTANKIILLSKTIAEYQAEILKLNTQAEILVPWTALDVPMNFTGTKYTKAYIGTLQNQWTLEEIYGKLNEHSPLNVDIISSSKDQTCIFVLCRREKAEAVYEDLRGMEFSLPGFSFDLNPAKQLSDLKNQIEEAQKSIDQAIGQMKEFQKQNDTLLFLYDYDTMRLEKYDAIGHLLQSENVFFLSGYIAGSDTKTLSDELNEKYRIAIDFEEPSQEEEVPVKLKNNAFSEPLEWVVNAYSPPGRGEIDPTMIMAVFYYMLFGLMLGDAGYGLIMVFACGLGLIKYGKQMEHSTKNMLRMFLYCGIATIFWGVIFSSYFGDIVDVVSATYFGHKVSIPPLWFIPMNEPMRMLTFSMAIGIIHIFTGLGIKFYQLVKQKDYKAIIYDVLFWFVLLISCILLLLSMQMIVDLLGVSFKVPAKVADVASILAILASIGIVCTNGRESRNPFKRFLKGLYALYGISGYLSDVLSYSRLLALGLASGVIAMVINKMAAMVGGGPIGPFLFIIIVVAGHSLNIAINALGAYVHTNRLQYVEFFGKFYGGGGRLFAPFSNKTKYFKIKEKVNNEV
jgi:Archaeal/vacuolar-type H+-ATPase subunit I